MNHACFVLEVDGVRLLSDPWLDGTAFDDAWGLLSASSFRPEDFARVTHIWFSHEHPDHFHPPTLKRVPKELRARITVLFQSTTDRKVIDFCRELGFAATIELPSRQWFALTPEVSLYCCPCPGFQDSWLAVRTRQGTLLNLNDCPIFSEDEARSISATVGPVDVLATQFSISAWDGNSEELERRRAGAQTMLGRAVMQSDVLRARYVLPIASFIWFCHEENAFMNTGFLPLADVERGLRERSRAQPILMYPGDRWTLDAPWDNAPALTRYAADTASLPGRPRSRSRNVAAPLLVEQSRDFCRNMRAGSSLSRLKLRWARHSAHRRRPTAGALGKLFAIIRHLVTPELATLWITDHDCAYEFHPVRGLRASALPRQGCDISLSSGALSYAFRFLWGGETLLFNGRFRENSLGARACMFEYFFTAGSRNFGATASWSTLPSAIARGTQRTLLRPSRAGEREARP